MTQRNKETPADSTAEKQRGRPFKPGQSGNPAGRPRGSRQKLSEDLVNAFCADFEKNGVDAVERLRKEDLGTYMRVAASLLPKELNVNGHSTVHHQHDFNAVGLSASAAFIAQALGVGEGRTSKKPVPH